DRLQSYTQDAAVAIVDTALVQRAVQQQALALGDARLPVLACAPQCQHRPGSRLHPGKVVLRPRPADDGRVDIIDVAVVAADVAPLEPEQCRRRAVDVRLRIAQAGLD